MKIEELLHELETQWDAASLPGREAAERNAAWRGLWQILQRQPTARQPMRLRVVRS